MTNKPAAESDASEPAELPTAFVLVSDGRPYFHIEDAPPPDRSVFIGYALHADEVKAYGVQRLLAWAILHKLALGSDGQVYVQEGAIDPEGRDVFRGFAATDEEAGRMADEVHRLALNVNIAVLRRS